MKDRDDDDDDDERPSDGGDTSPLDEEIAASIAGETESRGAAGEQIAGRYVLVGRLGVGANGEVWKADDPVGRAPVAVKLLRPEFGVEAARARREVSTLRLMNLAGVAHLRDEGIDRGRAFLVMDLARGRHFPGKAGVLSWAELSKPVFALLETLSEVHAMGVVHRDLKPGNVLVDRSGTPTLLDFGLVYPIASDEDGVSGDEEIVGTPRYLAPEQITGEEITPRTDLYSLGVMLYGTLAGRPPHDEKNLRTLFVSRLTKAPPPLAELQPDVPPAVSDVVMRLLAASPNERPRSAIEVMSLLRGESPKEATPLPWLGPRGPIDAIVAAALAGRSVDVRGQAGSGRSRCMREAASQIEGAGKTVVWGAPEAAPEDAVVFVDDFDALDPASQAAALALREGRSVIVARAPGASGPGVVAVRLAPLREASLRALFAGPDRLLHLCEDAAAALFQRTDGDPHRIAVEIGAWVRAKIARWDRSQLVVSREQLLRLELGESVTPRRAAPADAAGLQIEMLSQNLEELLAWIALASPHSDVQTLGAILGVEPRALEADLRELLVRGAVRRRADGRIEAQIANRLEQSWPQARRRSAHLKVAAALPPGAPGRLLHLAAGATDIDGEAQLAIVKEALARASALADRGVLAPAVAALEEGSRAARRMGEVASSELLALLSLWVEIAVAEVTPEALDRVHYEICRTPQTEEIAHLESLVRAALAVGTWTDWPLQLAEAVKPFWSVRLEQCRQSVRVAAARRSSARREEAVLDDIAKNTPDDPAFQSAYYGWLARLRYRQARFDDAAELNAQSAALAPSVILRLSAELNGASALMEGFRLSEAFSIATEALAQAKKVRHALYEMRAEWLLRSIGYRDGTLYEPDEELVRAAAHIGVKQMEAAIVMNEAAVAYRGERTNVALPLARRAKRLYGIVGHEGCFMLSQGLCFVCGDEPLPGEVATLARQAKKNEIPRVALQAVALVARAGLLTEQDWTREETTELVAKVPRIGFSIPTEILSMDEVLEALGGDL